MQKRKEFDGVFFSAEVVRMAVDKLATIAGEGLTGEKLLAPSLTIGKADGDWTFDNAEEFFSEYRDSARTADFDVCSAKYRFKLDVHFLLRSTAVTVRAPTRHEIETIFNVFEARVAESQLPKIEEKPRKTKVFVGHGRSQLWRDLKDHLQDKHGYQVEAYEVGSRAGHTIRDILEEMLDESSCAFLVLTGEDETADGKLLARQNVVHETGLFQGRLGFSRAIVLLEEGTEEFSNIAGIQQIRFSKGNIKETFGEVLAVLRREFGN